MSSKGKSSTQAGGGTALVPKLRFPEFASHPIQDLELADATAASTERNGDGQAASQIMGVSKVAGIVPMEERIIAADTARYKFVRKDWFAYNPMRLNIGSIARWQGDEDILVSPDYVVFKCKSSGPHRLDPAYLDHFRRSDAWEEFVSEKGDGSVRVRIYYKDLARLQLALPSFPEQQKIADCLDSVDALIAAQGRKVEALRDHKKGLMQQLFPQEGETQPRLRVPEFEGEGEWVEEPLNSCLSRVIDYRGKAPPKSESGVPLITAKNVRLGWLDMSNDEYIDEDQYDSWMSRGFPRAGDVLFTTEAPLGNVALFPREGKFAVGQRLLTLRSNPKKCLSDFLFQSLLGPGMQGKIEYYSTGSTAKGIKSSVFVKIPFIRPKDVGEQRRIADCLTSLDDLIAAEIRKLDTHKTHKKGLMQQLFPQVGEAGT
jgi:type I restriction enzyme S subunit